MLKLAALLPDIYSRRSRNSTLYFYTFFEFHMSCLEILIFVLFGLGATLMGQLVLTQALLCLAALITICLTCKIFSPPRLSLFSLKKALIVGTIFYLWSFSQAPSPLELSSNFENWTAVELSLIAEKAKVTPQGAIHLLAKIKDVEDSKGLVYQELNNQELWLVLPKHTLWQEAWDSSLRWCGKLKITALGKIKFKAQYAKESSQPQKDSFFKQSCSYIHSHWQHFVWKIEKRSMKPGSHGSSLLTSMLAVGSCPVRVDFLLSRFGLKHLTAISGLHFSLVMSLLLIIFYRASTRLRLSIALLGTTFFLLATGINGSSTRAWLMSVLGCYCLWQQKEYEGLKALGLSALFWVFLVPSWVTNPGFILSYLCSFLLLVMAKIQRSHPDEPSPSQGSLAYKLMGLLSWQTWIFLSTAPFLLYWFHSLSWLSLPANLLIAPLLVIAFFLSVMACLFYWIAPLSSLLWTLAAQLCQSLLDTLDHLSLSLDQTLYYAPSPIELTLATTLLGCICFNWIKELFVEPYPKSSLS